MFVFQVTGQVPNDSVKAMMGLGSKIHQIAISTLGIKGIDAGDMGKVMTGMGPYVGSLMGQKSEFSALMPFIKNLEKDLALTTPLYGAQEELLLEYMSQMKKSSYVKEATKLVENERDYFKSQGMEREWNKLTFQEHLDAACYFLARMKVHVMSNLDESALHGNVGESLFKEFDRMLNDAYGVMNIMILEIIKTSNSQKEEGKPARKTSYKTPAKIPLESLAIAAGYGASYAAQSKEERMKEAKAYGYESLARASEDLAEKSCKIYLKIFSDAKQIQTSKNVFITHRKSQAAKEGEKRIMEDQDKEKSAYASKLRATVSEKMADAREQPEKEKKAEKKAKKDPNRELDFKVGGAGLT